MLAALWAQLKALIVAPRDAAGRAADIVATSEECWKLADGLVLQTQRDSEERSGDLSAFFVLIGINVLSICGVLFTINSYVKRKLEYASSFDALTGVLNRRSYQRVVPDEIRKAERFGYRLSAALLDIDLFKRVNDEHGHKVGDAVLKRTAATVGGLMRRDDSLFRIGGEEFFALLLHSTLDQAHQAAERWRQTVAALEFPVAGSVTVSMGIAEYRAGEGLDQFFLRVDAAMYLAKKNGRNRTERG